MSESRPIKRYQPVEMNEYATGDIFGLVRILKVTVNQRIEAIKLFIDSQIRPNDAQLIESWKLEALLELQKKLDEIKVPNY